MARSSGTVDHACSIRDLDLYRGRHAGVTRGTRPALQVQYTMPAASGILTSTWVACWSHTRNPARSSGTVDHACRIRDLDLYLGGMLESHEEPGPLFRYS